MRRHVWVLCAALVVASLSSAASAAPGGDERTPKVAVVGPAEILGVISGPRGVFVAPDGRAFFADWAGNAVYEYSDAAGLRKVISGIYRPHDLAMDAAGNLYVTQWEGGRLTILRPDGTLNSVTGLPYNGVSVAVESDGHVLFSSSDGVRRYSADFASYETLSASRGGYLAALKAGGAVFNEGFYSGRTSIMRPGVETKSLANQTINTEGIGVDPFDRMYIADSVTPRIVTLDMSGEVNVLTQLTFPAWDVAVDPRGWLYVSATTGLVRYPIEWSRPTSPRDVAAVPGDGSAVVTWNPPLDDGGAAVIDYTVVASPGGATCISANTTCAFTGLSNRQPYTFTVFARSAAGSGSKSEDTAPVMPLTPSFQTWPVNYVMANGSSTEISIAQAAPRASITVTGSAKATVTADPAGLGSMTFTASKAGIQKFTASYSVKVGKKTTKYTATTQLYVPSVMGPVLKIKQGKTGKFGLQFMPPGAPVVIALTDGRTINLTADSAGKASTTQVFDKRGAVNYTVTVAGVQVATGGLTIS